MSAAKKEFLGIPAGVWIIATVILVVITYPYWSPFFIEAPPTAYKYSTGLTAKFKVMDDTSSALVTANLKAEIFPATILETDVYSKTFITKALTVASYDSGLGAWTCSVDAGSYNVLVTDTQTTKTRYLTFDTITVGGTDNEDKETWAEPSTLHILQRATETISKDIKAYNATSFAYDITASTINATTYNKWRVVFTFTPAGEYKYLKAGKVFVSEITGLTPVSASVDGATASVMSDKDASDDSLVGYYVEYADDWEGGSVHTVTVFFEQTGTVTAGTMTLTHADSYEVFRTALKWWTYYTTTVTVQGS